MNCAEITRQYYWPFDENKTKMNEDRTSRKTRSKMVIGYPIYGYNQDMKAKRPPKRHALSSKLRLTILNILTLN